jgi:hypothetical protein
MLGRYFNLTFYHRTAFVFALPFFYELREKLFQENENQSLALNSEVKNPVV